MRRNYLAQELIETDIKNLLLQAEIANKVAELIILEWLDKWHSVFQKEIWLQRCDEVAKWKKELEIDS
ncbi:11977_t:CDS:1, partial [Gigaspora rosea]